MADTFVGRKGELERLLAACRRAAQGRGSVTVVAGEAGIGKTRLCQELTARARYNGMAVAMARCWHDGGAPAFWPWQPLLDEVGGTGTASLLAAEGPLPTDDRDRFARFAAVADRLAEACRQQPACLVIDDIHAADTPTLLLTRFIARSVHGLGLALVLSRRTGELAPPGGAPLLDEIEDEAELLRLHRFDPDETATFLAAQGLDEMDDGLLEVLVQVTGGNPLFLRRIAAGPSPRVAVHHLPGKESDRTHSLRAAIGQAFDRLSPQAREILRAAAVLGAAPSLADVAAMAGVDTRTVLEAVQEATDAGLTMEDDPGNVTFSHELVRSALESGLTPVERLDAHARAAEVVGCDGELVSAERLTRSAHHALSAAPRSPTDARLAVTACRAAAQSLVRNFAYEQADHLLSAATTLHATSNLGLPPGWLLVEWAQAALLCGRLADARTRFGQAVSAAEREQDPRMLAEATLGLGGYWLMESRSPLERARILRLQEAARATLPDHEVALQLRLTMRVAAEAFYNGGPIQPMQDALDAVRAYGDPEVLADALSLSHHALLAPEHAMTCLKLADELVRAGSEADHGVLGVMGLCWRTLDLFYLGDPRALSSLEDLRRRADALACQLILYVVDLIDVMLRIRAGDLDAAEAQAETVYERGIAIGETDAFAYLGAQISTIQWYRGDTAEMIDLMADIAASPELHATDFACQASAAVFAVENGQRERAREMLDDLAASGLDALPRSSTWLVGIEAITQTAALLGDEAVAREAYALLSPLADLPIVPSVGVVCHGSIHRPLGVAARTFGDHDLAVDHLERAVTANRRLGNRPAEAMARAELATTLSGTGSDDGRNRAADLLQRATAEADTMGMTKRAAVWRSLLEDLQGDPEPASTPEQRVAGRRGIIRREGRGWVVTVDDRTAHVGDLVGMRYLAELVTHPGRPILALTLAARDGVFVDSSRQDVLDLTARSSYEARARDLVDEMAQAEANADVGRAEQLREELDALIDELSKATGLAGRSRAFAGPAERARTAVRKAVMRAIRAMETADPVIADLFRTAITTGRTCVYTPDPQDTVTWSTGRDGGTPQDTGLHPPRRRPTLDDPAQS